MEMNHSGTPNVTIVVAGHSPVEKPAPANLQAGAPRAPQDSPFCRSDTKEFEVDRGRGQSSFDLEVAIESDVETTEPCHGHLGESVVDELTKI